MPTALSLELLHEAVDQLVAEDQPLRRVFERFGYPPLWARASGFATLIHIILEQQVSLASARAAMDRLIAALGEVTPGNFLTLDDAALRAIGFSRQKTRYGRELAQAILSGSLDIDGLARLADESVSAELIKIKGIGAWTANIYLLMVLRRPDIWPRGDRALAVGVKEVLELDKVPSYPDLDNIAQRWQPYRSVAARLIWHHYLNTRRTR